MPEFLGPVKGFGVTFRQMFRKVDTVQYPEERKPTAPRFHGRHQLNRWPDGLEKCIGCELCAWACPADAIYVEGADNTEDERYWLTGMKTFAETDPGLGPGGQVPSREHPFQTLQWADYSAKPAHEYTYRIYPVYGTPSALEPPMEAPPHPMRLGATERDYYLLGSGGVASREAGVAEDTPEGTLSEPSSAEMAAAGEAPDEQGDGDRAEEQG